MTDIQERFFLLIGTAWLRDPATDKLRVSGIPYRWKRLDSSPENWKSILLLLHNPSIMGVIGRLSGHVYSLIASPAYQEVAEPFFHALGNVAHVMFVHEALLKGEAPESLDDYEEGSGSICRPAARQRPVHPGRGPAQSGGRDADPGAVRKAARCARPGHYRARGPAGGLEAARRGVPGIPGDGQLREPGRADRAVPDRPRGLPRQHDGDGPRAARRPCTRSRRCGPRPSGSPPRRAPPTAPSAARRPRCTTSAASPTPTSSTSSRW